MPKCGVFVADPVATSLSKAGVNPWTSSLNL